MVVREPRERLGKTELRESWRLRCDVAEDTIVAALLAVEIRPKTPDPFEPIAEVEFPPLCEQSAIGSGQRRGEHALGFAGVEDTLSLPLQLASNSEFQARAAVQVDVAGPFGDRIPQNAGELLQVGRARLGECRCQFIIIDYVSGSG